MSINGFIKYKPQLRGTDVSSHPLLPLIQGANVCLTHDATKYECATPEGSPA